MELLRAVDGLNDTVPPDLMRARPDDFHTFPADKPNRKLDYVFVGDGFEVVSVEVIRKAGDISDHLPVVAKIRLK